MHRRKWLIIGIVAVCAVLVAGIVGGVAYAQTNTTTTPNATVPNATVTANTNVSGNQTNPFTAKVAEKLGISEQQLKDAIQQAKKELMDEALANKLAKLVEQGVITQAQADQYEQWWESRPDIPIGPQGKLGPLGKGFRNMGPRGFCGPGGGFPDLKATRQSTQATQ